MAGRALCYIDRTIPRKDNFLSSELTIRAHLLGIERKLVEAEALPVRSVATEADASTIAGETLAAFTQDEGDRMAAADLEALIWTESRDRLHPIPPWKRRCTT